MLWLVSLSLSSFIDITNSLFLLCPPFHFFVSRLSFIYLLSIFFCYYLTPSFWLIVTHGDKWEWPVCEQWRCLLLSLTATLFKYWFLGCIFNTFTYFCLWIITTYMNGLAPGSTSKNFLSPAMHNRIYSTHLMDGWSTSFYNHTLRNISNRLNTTIVIAYKLHTAHFLYKSIKVDYHLCMICVWVHWMTTEQ